MSNPSFKDKGRFDSKITDFFSPKASSSSSPSRASASHASESTAQPPRKTSSPRDQRRRIADDTLSAIKTGQYILNGTSYPLAQPTRDCINGTQYYAPDSTLSFWSTTLPNPPSSPGRVSLLETTTLDGARTLLSSLPTNPSPPKVGVLNFASATKPGGGFLSGAQAQEESIARSSNIYPSLISDVGEAFYTLHKRDKRGGYYTHAMIYSPGVTVFRDDAGAWIAPYQIDVLTSPAVNAGDVRGKLIKSGRDGPAALCNAEDEIERVMRERMARIFFLFELQGVRNVVLGSFGTGVFRNDVGFVAKTWVELLARDGARFRGSFDRVVFAILGKETYEKYVEVFEGYAPQFEGKTKMEE